jgi:hypothetical protein
MDPQLAQPLLQVWVKDIQFLLGPGQDQLKRMAADLNIDDYRIESKF